VKAAVFPLVAKDGMPEVAEKLHADLAERFWRVGNIEMDEKQSIGKRYARMDEAGTPFCITIDSDTLSGQMVTIRDRDTAQQEKVALDKVADWISTKLGV
jgi:glycyl-tRNA synthetase